MLLKAAQRKGHRGAPMYTVAELRAKIRCVSRNVIAVVRFYRQTLAAPPQGVDWYWLFLKPGKQGNVRGRRMNDPTVEVKS